jgi:phage tail-like protein
VVTHREGGDPSSPRLSPGQTTYEAITLERGVTHDPAFRQWADKVWNFGAGLGAEVSLKDFRKDIILELLNEGGANVLTVNIYRCWVSELTLLGELDASASVVAIQSMVLQNEGFRLDPSVTEPTEPSLTVPE